MKDKKKAPAKKKKRFLLWGGYLILFLMVSAFGWYIYTNFETLIPAPGPKAIAVTSKAHKIPPAPARVPVLPPPRTVSPSQAVLPPQAVQPAPQPVTPVITPATDVVQTPAINPPPVASDQSLPAANEQKQTIKTEEPAAAKVDPLQQIAAVEPKPQEPSQPEKSSAVPLPALNKTQPPDAPKVAQAATPAAPVAPEKTPPPKVETQIAVQPKQTAPAAKAEPVQKTLFTIQVGAYRTKEYADDKVAELRKRGYDPFIFETADAKKRTWYTVRFGHFENRGQADLTLDEFKKKENLTAVIALAKSL